jgi:replicative DNA helicase
MASPQHRDDLEQFTPPHDLVAEKCLLGSILLSSDAFYEVLTFLSAEYFYSGAHKQVYQAIKEMYETGMTGIDVVLLRDELEKRGQLGFVGGEKLLLEIMQTVPHAAHAEYYAKIVLEKYVRRRLIEVCETSIRDARAHGQEAQEIAARVEQELFHIVENFAMGDKMAVNEIMEETFARIFERIDKQGQTTGTTTGFNGLNDMTGGFQETELIVLAARPSMGKTALVCNFALAAAESGAGTLLFSLEQSKFELVERFLCIHAKVNGHKLRQGDLDEVEQHALMQASNELKKYPLFIDDVPGRTISQVVAISRRLKRRYDIKLIIIDYLQLIESDDKTLPREQQISTITRRLKFLAKDLRVPVIALAQLNRGVEAREDKRPRLADLRESGAIEQDADIVMFLHRPEAYDPEDRPGEADILIAKNRHGPIGVVELVWMKQALKFGDKSPLQEPVDF